MEQSYIDNLSRPGSRSETERVNVDPVRLRKGEDEGGGSWGTHLDSLRLISEELTVGSAFK